MPYDLDRFWANVIAAQQARLKTQECQHNLSAIGRNQNSTKNIE